MLMHPGRVGRIGRIGRPVDAGIPWAIDLAYAGELRDALATPTAWGETLGPELVANGGFGSAAGWTLGTGWAVSGGAATKTAGVGDAIHRAATLIVGRSYRFEYTVSGASAGTCAAALIGGTQVTGTLVGTNGTRVETLVAVSGNTSAGVTANGSFNGTIDNISVREVVTGWLLPGLGGARLSGDCRTSVAMQTEADGTVGFAAHNLHTKSEPTAAFVTDGTTPPTVGVGTLNGKPAVTVTFDQTMTASYVGSRALQSGASFSFVGGALYSQRQRVRLSRPLIAGESLSLYWTGSQGFIEAGISAANSAQFTGETGGLLANPANVALANGNSSPYIYLSGALSSPVTVTMTEFQANLGPTALPYVPTEAAARFGPAIDWLAGIGAYGIRTEAARTNLVLWSRDLTNAAWTKTNATAALTATGVDGAANTASTLTATAANGTALQSITSASADRALSVYLRRRTGTGTVETTINGGTTWVARTLTGTWQRFDTTLAAVTNPNVGVRIVTSGDAVDVDIVQCETGTEASSPIITLSATVTRAADTLDVLDSGWINQTEGTLAVTGIRTAAGTANFPLLAGLRGTTGNTIGVGYINPTVAALEVTTGGVSQVGLYPVVATDLRSVAARYAANDFAISVNGGAVSADTSATVPGTSGLMLGGSIGGTNQLNGHLTRVRYSRRRLTNEQLQALTSGESLDFSQPENSMYIPFIW